jgi:serine protease Do
MSGLPQFRFDLPPHCILGVAISVLIAGPATAQEPASAEPPAAVLVLEQTLIRAIEQAEASVVSIARVRASRQPENTQPFERVHPFQREPDPRLDRLNPASPEFIPNEFGSGIILAPAHDPEDRLILTNYHVVRGGPVFEQRQAGEAQRLFIRFSDRRGCEASIFAADPRSDLAVLKLETAGSDLKLNELRPARISTRDDFRKGRLVISLGNPYALARDGSASASWGMISNVSRLPAPVEFPLESESLKQTTLHHHGTLLQIDTRLNLGTSGGAVLNIEGEFIGITTALAALDGYEKSVGYAIPFDAAVRRIIDDLCRGYEVEYGMLGVAPRSAPPHELRLMREATGRQQASAAMVQATSRNSPAATAGLQAGDVILAIDGRPIYSQQDLMRDVGEGSPGKTVELQIWRRGARNVMNISVTLGKWPVHDDEGIVASRSRHLDWRGVTVDYPTARVKFIESYRFPEGVLALGVESQSPAGSAGLQEGDFITQVNRTAVRTPAEFHEAVRNLDGQPVTLQLIGKKAVIVPAAPPVNLRR